MEKAKIRRIAVVLRLSYASGRDLLFGISQYARRKCRWQFHVINFQGDATAEELHSAVAEGKLDGMIANAADNHAIAKMLEASSIPLVVIGARTPLLTRKDAIAFVHNDDIAIGRRGAEYLTSLGRFRSYGFIARSVDSCNYVPVLRERGFRSALGNIGGDVRTYVTAVNVKLGSYDDINRLGEWLKALPKPAAIMAAHDLRATHVIEAAKASGLVIPNDIALVGVDNDELACETSEPTLTSIAPDHVRLGELAAACLRRIMANPSSMSFESLLPVKTVIERQSTRHVTPSAQLVERATSYIRRNALKGIGAVDVVRHLGVSRRLADVRFRQATGQSILSAIMKTRLDEVKRRLRDTDTPIAKITAACGFHGENYAKKLFKSRFGVSMTKWRAQHTIA
jgi:LacI family transcriptional regulator